MSTNDITGDKIKTKVNSDQDKFAEGHDRIWGKKDEPKVPAGYTAEELEADNPYNRWMHEK